MCLLGHIRIDIPLEEGEPSLTPLGPLGHPPTHPNSQRTPAMVITPGPAAPSVSASSTGCVEHGWPHFGSPLSRPSVASHLCPDCRPKGAGVGSAAARRVGREMKGMAIMRFEFRVCAALADTRVTAAPRGRSKVWGPKVGARHVAC